MAKTKKYQVTKAKDFQLSEYKTAIELKLSKEEIKEEIEKNIKDLKDHQEKLYAQDRKIKGF